MAGLYLPLHPMEHQYIVTDDIPEIYERAEEHPHMMDPAGESYLRQEGRGIGLTEKIKAYQLQDQGFDTFDANVQLGDLPDNRNYDMLADVFAHLNVKQVKLMTNNPDKIQAIESQGVEVVERLPIKVGHNPHNQLYLQTKLDKFNHF